jgi:hypothetical protein
VANNVAKTSPTRIDPLQVYQLRVTARLSYPQIAKQLDCSVAGAYYAFRRLADLGHATADYVAYTSAKAQLLSSAEEGLLASLLDPASIDKASLNNRAYAFKAVHEALRLERELSTQNISSKMSLLISHADATLFAAPPSDSPPPLEPAVGGDTEA